MHSRSWSTLPTANFCVDAHTDALASCSAPAGGGPWPSVGPIGRGSYAQVLARHAPCVFKTFWTVLRLVPSLSGWPSVSLQAQYTNCSERCGDRGTPPERWYSR